METGGIFWALTGLLLVALIVYFIHIYNRLVSLKHGVSRSWSNIDVLLKQRHDELPKLVEVCKRYMGYEQETLERVMNARSRVAQARAGADLRALGQAETELRQGLGGLFAVAEAYPQLKADATFRHLEERISALEESIADRREFYNESVNLNNVRVEQFPDVLVASRFGFAPFDLLEFEERERADVDLGALFAG
ncbi:MAG TPA: LemA family protein [Gammaproteobacteria bacterium]|nr:LemA family protein [Gammaproteobacteria bacterium]